MIGMEQDPNPNEEQPQTMFTVQLLSSEFAARHDFDDDDLNVLKNNFSGISFANIPGAWIPLIDKMLCRISQRVRSVEQHCGFLVVNWNSQPDEREEKVVASIERRLYQIDEDLHRLLNYKRV